MGDRAQLQITDGTHSIFLYTHWGGSELATALHHGLSHPARSLSEDPGYCMGNIVKAVVKYSGGVTPETGFGIGFDFKDNDDERGEPLILNVTAGTVTFKAETLRLAEFLAKPAALKWA